MVAYCSMSTAGDQAIGDSIKVGLQPTTKDIVERHQLEGSEDETDQAEFRFHQILQPWPDH